MPVNGQLQQPPGERVDDDRVDRHDVRRRHARVVHRDDGRAQLGGSRSELLDALRPGDPLTQEERGPRLDRDKIEILDDPQDLAGRRQDREVPEAAVEHVQQRLPAETVGRTRVRGADIAAETGAWPAARRRRPACADRGR